MNKLTQQCLHQLYQNSAMTKNLPKLKTTFRRNMFQTSPQMTYLLKNYIHTGSLPNTYKVLRSHGYGKPPVIEEIPLPKPGKNEVLIKMEYAPLNPTDIEAMNGLYATIKSPPYTVGSEGSGTIVAVGQDLKVPLKVGDKVHALGTGSMGELNIGTIGQYYLADAYTCTPIQGNLSMQQAACHWICPGTAYYMSSLTQRGGHKAAIHTAGASTVGRMVIRLFKAKGIKLINIVRDQDVIEDLKKDGADYVLNSSDPDFETKLKEIAAKEGATIAFDAICGKFTSKLIECMPYGSTIHCYGMLSKETNVNVSFFDLLMGKNLKGMLQANFLQESHKAGKLPEILNEVHSYLPTALKTNIQKEFDLREFNIKDLNEAVAFHFEHGAKGRVLLKLA